MFFCAKQPKIRYLVVRLSIKTGVGTEENQHERRKIRVFLQFVHLHLWNLMVE